MRDSDQKDEVQPFNDATEYLHTIVGMPTKKADLSSMPKAVRWFIYLVFTLIAIGVFVLIIGIVKQK
jgi:hypothetical protein